MRPLRLLLAFIGGSWLYYVAVILIGGYMAAVSIPKGYFTYFGAEHNEVALALLSLFTWAVPVGGCVCAGLLALHRLLSPEAGALALWLAVSGMVVSFLFFATASATSDLLQSFVLPWWAASSFLAPWAGAGFAFWLAFRRRGTLRHA
jgi:hypothetical protein